MTTKTGIFLAWGGMSFIDTWPNINSVCDLPGLFWGQFLVLGGFCRCSLLFLGGGWWWFGCCCFCCCCSSYCCGCSPCLVVVVFWGCCLAVFFFFVVVVVVFLFLFFVGHSTPKGKNETKVCFPVFWGAPFPFFPFCSCLLIFLVVSHLFFPFLLESLDVVYMAALRQRDDIIR